MDQEQIQVNIPGEQIQIDIPGEQTQIDIPGEQIQEFKIVGEQEIISKNGYSVNSFYEQSHFCDNLFKGNNEEERNRHYQTCMFAYN